MSVMASEAIHKTVLVDFTPEEAFELCDRVVVLERAPREERGGQSRYTGATS